MGTKNSSLETRERAKKIANELGSFHFDATIDEIVNKMINTSTKIIGKEPQ